MDVAFLQKVFNVMSSKRFAMEISHSLVFTHTVTARRERERERKEVNMKGSVSKAASG